MYKSIYSLVVVCLWSLAGSGAGADEVIVELSSYTSLVKLNSENDGYTPDSKPAQGIHDLIVEVIGYIEGKSGKSSELLWPDSFGKAKGDYSLKKGAGAAFAEQAKKASEIRSKFYDAVTDAIQKGDSSILGTYVVPVENSDKCITRGSQRIDCVIANQAGMDLEFVLQILSKLRVDEYSFQLSMNQMGVILESRIRRRNWLVNSQDLYADPVGELVSMAGIYADQLRGLAENVMAE